MLFLPKVAWTEWRIAAQKARKISPQGSTQTEHGNRTSMHTTQGQLASFLNTCVSLVELLVTPR